MSFYVLTAYAVLTCIALVTLMIIIPRSIASGRLRSQLQQGGHRFTPDVKTWRGYLARTNPGRPLLSMFLYSGLLVTFWLVDPGPAAYAVGIGIGVFLLLRYLLHMVPATYGVTGKGITVLSWLPNFPLGPFGSGSVFIPWKSVEICAIDFLYLTVLTGRQEARVVYPPELEEKICTFIDSVLRRMGYRTNAAG